MQTGEFKVLPTTGLSYQPRLVKREIARRSRLDRPARRVKFRRPFEFICAAMACALPHALFGLIIEQLRLRRRAAQAGDVFHDDRPFIGTAADAEFVAGADDAARFGALAVDLDFAASSPLRQRMSGS